MRSSDLRFSGRYFPVLEVNLGIQSKQGKIRTRKNSTFGHFSHSVLWTPTDFLDNIPKYSYMFSQLRSCSAKWICFCCQVFQIWLLIQRVVGLVVGGSESKWVVVAWLVGRWLVDLINFRKKHVWGSDFAFALWSRFILLFQF